MIHNHSPRSFAAVNSLVGMSSSSNWIIEYKLSIKQYHKFESNFWFYQQVFLTFGINHGELIKYLIDFTSSLECVHHWIKQCSTSRKGHKCKYSHFHINCWVFYQHNKTWRHIIKNGDENRWSSYKICHFLLFTYRLIGWKHRLPRQQPLRSF